MSVENSNEPVLEHAVPSDPAVARELVKEIALDIGKDTAVYIEVMYPETVAAASSTFLLSLRNHIYGNYIDDSLGD